MPVTSACFTTAGIVHGTTTASCGDMKIPQQRKSFLSSNHLPENRLLTLKQTHSDIIIPVRSARNAETYLAGQPQEADAWLLAASGFGAAIMTADCAPVFLIDSSRTIAGLAHAGWKGAAKRIHVKLAEMMAAETGTKLPLRAYIGPHIKPCCFEIGPDVEQSFPGAEIISRAGRKYMDLGGEIKRGLIASGIPAENIELSGECTCCGRDYYSFRRDRTEKRLLSYIYI